MRAGRSIAAAAIGLAIFTTTLVHQTEYRNGWQVFGYRLKKKPRPFRTRAYKYNPRYANSSNATLEEAMNRCVPAAIYEIGRRHERGFQKRLKAFAQVPDWSTRPPKEIGFFLHPCKLPALAVLAKWGDSDAEEELCRGAQSFPGGERKIAEALAYVNSPNTVKALMAFKIDGSPSYRCIPGSIEESCWTLSERLEVFPVSRK